MKSLIIFLFILPLISLSQVGIGTNDPKAMLDVRESNPAAPTAASGIAIPQVDVLPPAGNRVGQMVILTTDNRPYYFNGTDWVTTTTTSYASSASGGPILWQSGGAVVFSSINATRVAATAPTVDTDAIINRREYIEYADGYVDETIVVSSNGSGGTPGTGYYIIAPQFNIDLTRHAVYSGNLNVSLTNVPNSLAANIGEGTISVTPNFNAHAYAIPIATNQIAIGTIEGRSGNQFVQSGTHFTMGSFDNWQLILKLRYKKAP